MHFLHILGHILTITYRFGRGVISQPTSGFGRASWVPPVGSGAKPRPQTHFLHILSHRTLLVERKKISFSVKFSSMNYWSNNNFVAVQSYGGQLPPLPLSYVTTPPIIGYISPCLLLSLLPHISVFNTCTAILLAGMSFRRLLKVVRNITNDYFENTDVFVT